MSTYVNALKSAKDFFQCFFALFSFDFIGYLHNEISKYWKSNDMNNDKCCSHEHCKTMEVAIQLFLLFKEISSVKSCNVYL